MAIRAPAATTTACIIGFGHIGHLTGIDAAFFVVTQGFAMAVDVPFGCDGAIWGEVCWF